MAARTPRARDAAACARGAPGLQHCHAPDDTGTPGWRADHALPPCAVRITAPHDPEARGATKRATSWLGDTVHLTATGDADLPHLLTAVQTTAATAADSSVIAAVHADLAAAALLPQEHLVDAGSLDADNLVARRQDHGVDLVGPPLADTHWQARTAGAFDIACCTIEWAARRVTCPQGHASGKWSETQDPYGTPIITMRFAPAACRPCPSRAQGTRSAQDARRLTLRPQAPHLALRAARARQATPAFATQYAARAGIAGTISQGVNALALRDARSIGRAKTHLQQLLTGAALHVGRLAAWFAERPRAATRPSRLACLAA